MEGERWRQGEERGMGENGDREVWGRMVETIIFEK